MICSRGEHGGSQTPQFSFENHPPFLVIEKNSPQMRQWTHSWGVHVRPVWVSVDSVNASQRTTREEYRRKIQQRQTVVFGSITALMAVLLLLAMLVWTGIVPFPVKVAFSEKPDPKQVVTPCLPDGTTAVDLSTITINYYNSTKRSGIAAEAAQQLGELGVVKASVSNWGSSTTFEKSARIQANAQSIAAAYTIARYIPGAVIQYNPDISGETLNLILGDKWEKISDPTSIDTSAALESAPGCTNISQDGE